MTVAVTVTGDAVCMIVGDNGRGMPPDVAARVFEPFFTTRRYTGGSGLGMHITHTLVTSRFFGTIDPDTAPGRGTRWILRFPFGTAALTRKEDMSDDHAP